MNAETLTAHGLTVAAVFIPQAESRNAREKYRTLNWRITLQHRGRGILSFDYSAGAAHCPAYALSVKEAGGHNSLMRDEFLKHECETGRTYTRWGKTGAPILPNPVDVVASVILDAGALDCSGFAEWCADYGYDDDSMKARAIYDVCLKHGLALRAALGSTVFDSLREAFQNY